MFLFASLDQILLTTEAASWSCDLMFIDQHWNDGSRAYIYSAQQMNGGPVQIYNNSRYVFIFLITTKLKFKGFTIQTKTNVSQSQFVLISNVKLHSLFTLK